MLVFDLTDLKDTLNFLFTARGENKVRYWFIILTFLKKMLTLKARAKNKASTQKFIAIISYIGESMVTENDKYYKVLLKKWNAFLELQRALKKDCWQQISDIRKSRLIKSNRSRLKVGFVVNVIWVEASMFKTFLLSTYYIPS